MRKPWLNILLAILLLFTTLPPTAAEAAPAAPTNLQAVIGDSQIKLRWDDMGVEGYEVEHKVSGSVYAGIVSGMVYATNYTVTGLINDTAYDFFVRSIDSGQLSANAQITATPTAAAGTTVTDLEIEDPIAPILGRAPVTTIIPTDEYTGTINWQGNPEVFEPNQLYTATITLTPKEGYTFNGVEADAIKVPSAKSATNGIDSGVVTVTFMSPRSGYITDGYGHMAYKLNPGNGRFDMQGTFQGDWQRSTYADAGYRTRYKYGAVDRQVQGDVFSAPYDLENGLTLQLFPEFYGQGNFLRFRYVLKNNGTEAQTVSLGSSADIQIGNDDHAPITKFADGSGFRMVNQNTQAEFNFFGKGGGTDVDTFWFGHYSDAYNNIFTQVQINAYNGDSGMAYSWQDRVINPGATLQFAVPIGVGEDIDVSNLPVTVIFDSQGGSDVPMASVTAGETIAAPAAPTLAKHVFRGWYTEPECQNLFDFTTPINSHITLYAKWQKKGGAGSGVVEEEEETPPATTETETTETETQDETQEPPAEWQNPFVDVAEDAWYYSAVAYNHQAGLLVGTSHDHFSPAETVSRAMLVTVLHRLAGSPAPQGDTAFDDVAPDAWYAQSVQWADEMDIAVGYGEQEFGPEDEVTREQLVRMLHNYAKLQGYDMSAEEDLSQFPDGDSVSDWAIDGMKWAVKHGLIQGDENSLLNPQAYATRAELAVIIQRFVSLFVSAV